MSEEQISQIDFKRQVIHFIKTRMKLPFASWVFLILGILLFMYSMDLLARKVYPIRSYNVDEASALLIQAIQVTEISITGCAILVTSMLCFGFSKIIQLLSK